MYTACTRHLVRRYALPTDRLLPKWRWAWPYVFFQIWYHRSMLEIARTRDQRGGADRSSEACARVGDDPRTSSCLRHRKAVFLSDPAAGRKRDSRSYFL